MKIRVLSAFFSLFFILMPGTGEAFVPQTPHLLHLVMEKIKQPAGIEVYQNKKVLNYQNTETGFFELAEKLYFLYPSRFRAEIISQTLSSFSVESDFSFVKVRDGRIVSQEKSLVDLYTDILLYRDHENLANQLVRAGIDTTKVTFQRYKETICYVIGKPLGKGRPFAGLWIEKGSFLPLKYVVVKNGMVAEFLYTNWQRISKTWYPNQISIFLDNQLFAMIGAQRVDLKSVFPRSLFDIEQIEQVYPKNDPDPLDETTRPLDEIEKRMEEFKKLYE